MTSDTPRSGVCFAHVTNQMGQAGDFDKGEANGATAAIDLIHLIGRAVAG
ncbi:MAG: hypothetical protein AB7O43_03200 [Hyphomicrobiaceae bacterium]